MSHHWHANVGIAWCPCDEDQDAPGAVTAVPPRPAAPEVSELDAFLDELHDRIDEIEGSRLVVGPGCADIWLHTPRQVRTWLEEARNAWARGEYRTAAS